jgi:hypothetical protein
MSLLSAVALTVAVCVGGTVHAQVPGTWKINLAKSKFAAGQAPKSSTVIYEAAGAAVKVTVDIVPATGAPIHYSYTANFDGKDVPVAGNPNADTAARTRVDANTTRIVNKKAGKITSTVTIVTSADGKTMTITTKGMDATGAVDSIAIYDKL